MKPFRERNPVPIAIVSIAFLAGAMVLAFEAKNLSFLGGGGPEYHADFTDAAGLKSGDKVRIAGVDEGSVTSIDLAGDHVRVTMQMKPDMHLPAGTKADIKIETLLGQEYVAVQPLGEGELHDDIPVSLTTTPITVPQAFGGLSSRIEQIDTGKLGQAFETMAEAFKGTPPYVKSSLQGLTRLSKTISSRDQQLTELLAHAQDVTRTLASRDAQIRLLIDDGHQVLSLVEEQRAVIHQLLLDTTALSQQLSGLVADDQAQLGPALANVQAVLAILQKDQTQLDALLHELGPFVRVFANVLGNGPWFDTIVTNLAAVNGTPTTGCVPPGTPGITAHPPGCPS